MTTPAFKALRRLQEGNRRWLAGDASAKSPLDPERRGKLAIAQNPFAVLLGCSDSRVPPELIFDQSLGDLFIVRVAGNIATPTQVGSIEFAVESFGTPLVVVLGHSNCGAILGTIDACENPDAEHSENLQAILEHIRPTVEPLLRTPGERAAIVDEAIRANVRATAAGIAAQSDALAARVRSGQLLIVGAEYDLETGAVDFFHVPEGAP